MTHTYNISGMTCMNCVAKVKSVLQKMDNVTEADVQLAAPQATISMQKHIPVDTLQSSLQKAGSYTITEADGGMHMATSTGEETKTWLETYKPILLVFFYIALVSVIAATLTSGFNGMTIVSSDSAKSVIQSWHTTIFPPYFIAMRVFMRFFMSGFFLAFSFFKLLDLNGFADNYSSYDIIAKRFRAWGFIYAFVELLLGIAYAINFRPLLTNAITFIVMSISIIGVLQSVFNKKKIKCACLGAIFNLPMSTVTIVEDALMIVMSGVMVIVLL